MIKTFAIELLRSTWMIHEPFAEYYGKIAYDLLMGKEINTDIFGTLQLPSVPENIAMVVMNGVLTKSDICGSQGSRTLTMQIEKAVANPNINGIIVLSENCPGGQVDGTEALANAVAKATTKKPVLGAISGMACSAATWVLSQCTETYATSNTDFSGCIGVMSRMRNPKTINAETDNYVEVVSSLSPDKNSETKSVEQYRQSTLDPLCQLFHSAVVKGRGGRLKLEKENVLSGKTYIAQQAKDYGLIDGVMSFNKIVARVGFLRNRG